MTTQDKIKVIAEYDGWELRGEPDFKAPYKIWVKKLRHGSNMIPYISPSGKEYNGWSNDMKYLTSLDWLMPVAVRVWRQVSSCEFYNDISDITDRCENIHNAMLTVPVFGEYIDLFNAVYDGIIFLNSNK